MATRALALVLPFATLVMGCADKPPPMTPDNSQVAVASVDSRIQGDWRLEKFVPVQSLGPALDTLLAYQTQNLVVHISPKQVSAESPSMHVIRRYEIREASGDRFTIVLYDDQGVPYESRANFTAPDVVEAQSTSDPWRGTATLRRLPH